MRCISSSRLACWLLALLCCSSQVQLQLHLGVAAMQPAATSLGSAQQQQQAVRPYTPLVQTSIPARYCPHGWSLEGGLCYARCEQGWTGLACTCWKGLDSYSRGCGVKPSVCHARSYRQQRLPPVTDRAPFSLLLSADPQLFRVGSKYRQVKKGRDEGLGVVGLVRPGWSSG
jgi:hypothetical protein